MPSIINFFLTQEENENRIRAAHGDNYQRLVEVKTKWDPQNLLRRNKNIAPRPPRGGNLPGPV